LQKDNKQHFARGGSGAVTLPGTTKPLGITQIKPVCRFIEGAMKVRRIDKGFYKVEILTYSNVSV
jgi:hypothetical protein